MIDFFLYQFFGSFEVGFFFFIDEGDGYIIFIGLVGMFNLVNIVFGLIGYIDVDYMRYIVDVYIFGDQVGGNQDVMFF